MTPAVAVVAALVIVGVVARPFRWPEAVWAVAGAAILVIAGSVTPAAALAAIARGSDVYLFLVGMMMLSETARAEGVFDWIAGHAAARAQGSPARLFALVYAIGIVVTAILSNDATAVVLTPAVHAVARRAKVDPLPHLFACALAANAGSFVLPISNPANLVLFGRALPPLDAWLARFALPSVAAILATFVALRVAMRRRLGGTAARIEPDTPLGGGAAIALAGIGATALLLVAASVLGRPLGLPTFAAASVTAAVPAIRRRRLPVAVLRGVSWGVIALVAGLFVIVEAVAATGLAAVLGGMLAAWPAAGVATATAIATNLANNLPVGLLAADIVARAAPPPTIVDVLTIAVDLGPNLAITGSLATILWLQALRREGIDVSFFAFLRIGAIAMPPALAAAVAMRLALA